MKPKEEYKTQLKELTNSNNSIISLEGMEFFAYHGFIKEEQIIGTKFIVDLFFETDTSQAEVSDKLSHTVNYHEVYKVVSKEMQIRSNLLENICSRILQSVFNSFPSIESARVKLSKINPPLGGKTDKVTISIYKSRNDI